MNECVCCGAPGPLKNDVCLDCTPDGPGDSTNGCGPGSWHCVCDRSCDGSGCEVLIAEYRATGESEGGVPSTNILAYRIEPDSGDISEWADVLYHYSELDKEVLDRRTCDVRSVSEQQMQRTISDALELGYVQTYPEGSRV